MPTQPSGPSLEDLLALLGRKTFGMSRPELDKLFETTLLAEGAATKTSDWIPRLKTTFPLATGEQLKKAAKALVLLAKSSPPGKGGKEQALSQVLTALGIKHEEPVPGWLKDMIREDHAADQGKRAHVKKAATKDKATKAMETIAGRRAKASQKQKQAAQQQKQAAATRVSQQEARIAAARKAGVQKMLGVRGVPAAAGAKAPPGGGVRRPTPPRGGGKGVPGTRPAGAMPFQALLRAMMAGKGKKMPTDAAKFMGQAGAASTLLPLLLLLTGAHPGQKQLPAGGPIQPSEILPAVRPGTRGAAAGAGALPLLEGVARARPMPGAGAGGGRGTIQGLLTAGGGGAGAGGPPLAGAAGAGAAKAGAGPGGLGKVLGFLGKHWKGAGTGVLLGLLLASLFREGVTGPQELRTQGEVGLASMPPPELTALQGAVPQQGAQNMALFQTLMQQMGGGGRSPVGGEMAL